MLCTWSQQQLQRYTTFSPSLPPAPVYIPQAWCHLRGNLLSEVEVYQVKEERLGKPGVNGFLCVLRTYQICPTCEASLQVWTGLRLSVVCCVECVSVCVYVCVISLACSPAGVSVTQGVRAICLSTLCPVSKFLVVSNLQIHVNFCWSLFMTEYATLTNICN